MKNLLSLTKGLLLSSVLTIMFSAVAFGAEPTTQKPTLSNADCVKCHAAAPADIAANGGAHKTNVTCQDCHAGHPPTVKKIIPLCSQCHEGKTHYKLSGCLPLPQQSTYPQDHQASQQHHRRVSDLPLPADRQTEAG